MSDSERLTIGLEAGATTTAIVYPGARRRDAHPSGPGATLVLGHGAGAGQHSAFMVEFARALADGGIDIVTFNFLYTEQGRRIPDRAPALEACYRAVVRAVRQRVDSASRTLVIGGKSMGGRIASQVAAADPALPVAGLVLLGYPLHPPGRPDRPRQAHLPAIGKPMLFVQGSRDAFGTPAELETVLARIMPSPALHVVEGGDHSFKVGKRDPAAQQAVYATVQTAIVEWVRGLTR